MAVHHRINSGWGNSGRVSEGDHPAPRLGNHLALKLGNHLALEASKLGNCP